MRFLPHARRREVARNGRAEPRRRVLLRQDPGLLRADAARRRPRPDRLPRGADARKPVPRPGCEGRRDVRREVRRQPLLRRHRVQACTDRHDTTTTTHDDRRRRRRQLHGSRKEVFASAGCGGCHTLKDAGSSGNVGPNLDDLKPSEARRRAPGRGRRRPDARVQGHAHAGADQGRRDLRRDGRRQVDRALAQALAERDVRRVARAEIDARKLRPAVLRIEVARLARAELRREERTVMRLARQELRQHRAADAPPLG